MPMTMTFRGGQPLEKLSWEIEQATRIHAADTLLILNQQKSRILERTALGRDINGGAFQGYSTRGPYYYYPFKAERQGKLDLRLSLFQYSQMSLFGRESNAQTSFGKYQAGRDSASISRFAKKTGGTKVGGGIKYASYAGFKSSLGPSPCAK